MLPQRKQINPLEVQDEDQIFNEFEHVHKKVAPHKETKPVEPIKHMNKNERTLARVYRIPPEIIDEIQSLKNKKHRYNLRNYQTNLLKLINDTLSKEHAIKLERRFIRLRHSVEKQYETNFDFIREIEQNEEKIIKNINYTESYCEKVSNTKYKEFCIKDGFQLPQIKFDKIIQYDQRSRTFYVNSPTRNKTKLIKKPFTSRYYTSEGFNRKKILLTN